MLSVLCAHFVLGYAISAAQQTSLRKDAAACQLASAVLSASGYQPLVEVSTDTVGTYTVAATGEIDPIHVITLGRDKTRIEIEASAGKSIRILSHGRARFHPSVGDTKDLSTTNTFRERVPTNPSLSLLAECDSPNVQAIDGGEVTQDGSVLYAIDLAWTAHPANPTSIVAKDELRLSKTRFLIDTRAGTVVEVDDDHFGENDSTVPFHYRTVYTAYKLESGHLIPHEIATYINSRLDDTITVLSYQESAPADAQQFALEALQ
jgi:hypothetical protein